MGWRFRNSRFRVDRLDKVFVVCAYIVDISSQLLCLHGA